MKLCWLIPDDRGGGVATVALSCCRQAAKAGHETTLLSAFSPTGRLGVGHDFQVASLDLTAPGADAPARLIRWLEDNPQDILLLNGCEEAEPIIPYLHSSVKCVYVVHDTAPRFWRTAVEEEENLDGIIAVSHVLAAKFQKNLKSVSKLAVIHNGCTFPDAPGPDSHRQNDLIFLGGSNLLKGAFDVLTLWKELVESGFEGKLHWFGAIDKGFSANISKLPERSRICSYGHVPRHHIFSVAASTKVLLVLSHVESFGMATIEAMSMGCVPVAWDIPTGTSEIITANETGLLAPLGDMAALARQAMRACEEYQILGPASMRRARECFDEAVMWNQYECFLSSIHSSPAVVRSKQGRRPEPFSPPTRYFQLLPPAIRGSIKELVARYPRLSYWVRDFRGR